MKRMLFITGVVLLFLAGCGTRDKKARLEKLKKERDRIAIEIQKLEKDIYPLGIASAYPVRVESLTKRPFVHYIEVQGKVDGNENIGVSPQTVGVVTHILVTEGDFVKKGHVLAELDADVLKRSLKELETQLNFATDLYQKQKNLWDQKIGSEVQYLTAKNNMEALQNKIATVNDQIKMSSIISPIDGTVEEIPIKVGQMASAGVPAFRIINFSKAKAVAEVGESYSSSIKTGDEVKIFLPDLNVEHTEKVTFSSKYINPTNRTFTVEAALPSDNEVYRANMIAVVRIRDYSKSSVIAVPQNFIQSSKNEGDYIFLAKEENGKKVARKAFIKPGITYNGLTEILSGLNEGDLLITSGYKDIYEGQSIRY
ncbi:MAG: efflux RND transporter periplasmic adaptor subunit [Bacteroidota bacterium]|nr:efflux RND transporter periplasmic adaptor subunit [Bacteroidota bacterium]